MPMPQLTMPDFNFTYWQQHLIEFSIRGYVRSIGFFFWPMLFAGVIAYIYIKNQSAVSAAAGILIIFSCFVTSGVLLAIPSFVLLMQGVVILAISGLVTYFFVKRRQ